MHLLAHRGASATHPENTIPAFDAALLRGVAGFETDLRLCADGVVVCHDATLRRFGGSAAPVLRRRRADLATADVGRWKARRYAGTGVIDLRTLLTRYGTRCRMWLEFKPQPDARLAKRLVDATLAAIADAGCAERCHLLCFDARVLAYAKRRAPQIPRVWNRAHPPRDLAPAKACGAAIIDAALDQWTPEAAARIRGAGYQTAAYSADTKAALAHARRCQLDWLMTNDPARLVRIW